MNDTIGWRYALAYTYGFENYIISVETDVPNDWAYDEKISVVYGNEMENMGDGSIMLTNCSHAVITVKDGKILSNQIVNTGVTGRYTPYDWRTTFSSLGAMRAYQTIETAAHGVNHEFFFELCTYGVLPAVITAIIFKEVNKIAKRH